jgi:hypothetical protein
MPVPAGTQGVGVPVSMLEGPCGWSVDVSCCADWATYGPALQQSAAEFGAYVMWAATGRRYGVCEITARPCGRTCGPNLYSGYFWSNGAWQPYNLGGIWYNSTCGCNGLGNCASCRPLCQVSLPGPVNSIPATGVSVDGVVIPVDAWRVDNGKWLVRTDGSCWPECQDYNVDSGVGTFFVTYNRGLDVPNVVAAAAGELACEWAKSCLGQACRLPQRVQSVSRQGVSVSMVPPEILLSMGLTGVDTVDQIIRSVNPGGLTSPMRVSSPDTPVTRYVTSL